MHKKFFYLEVEMKKKIDVAEILLNEFLNRVPDERENLNIDTKIKLETEFVASLTKTQKQNYQKLLDEIYRCEMFHDRALVDYVLSFMGSIFSKN